MRPGRQDLNVIFFTFRSCRPGRGHRPPGDWGIVLKFFETAIYFWNFNFFLNTKMKKIPCRGTRPSRMTSPMRRRASRRSPKRCQVRQTGLWRRSSTEAGPEGASSCLSPGREAAAHVGSKESAQLTKSVQEHSEQVSFLIYSPHMSRLISCLG